MKFKAVTRARKSHRSCAFLVHQLTLLSLRRLCLVLIWYDMIGKSLTSAEKLADNPLNLLHETKDRKETKWKTELPRRNSPCNSSWRLSWARKRVYGGLICETCGLKDGSERVGEWWMMRLVNQQRQMTVIGTGRDESERQRDWDEVDEEKQWVDCRDKVKHIERNDQLFVTRMTLMAERGDRWRASAARTLNRDEFMQIPRLGVQFHLTLSCCNHLPIVKVGWTSALKWLICFGFCGPNVNL